NMSEDEKRRRTLEVLKFRGTPHQLGQWPFTILPDQGLQVIPLSAIELKQKSSDLRISSGIEELDTMCGGGFFRDSILLVSGATGTGKTLTATHFIKGGCDAGEKCLLFAFEESRQQLFRNAKGWGIDYEKMEQEGLLRVECAYPEIASLEDHLIIIKQQLDAFQPQRVVIDSCSALERVGTLRGFREFVIGLTSFIKQREVAGMFTATTPTLMGGESVTESHFSTITDSIILLRYVEMFGEMRRGITILKMRGSAHDKGIRAFDIDRDGMHIGEAFKNVTGILGGNPHHIPPGEIDRYRELYRDLT
ncbi:MAG: circadian clock protein KaiC, partial [Planctomycetota bacterium]